MKKQTKDDNKLTLAELSRIYKKIQIQEKLAEDKWYRGLTVDPSAQDLAVAIQDLYERVKKFLGIK